MKDGTGIDVAGLCVSKVPFFNQLPEKDLLKIVGLSTHKTYQKGEVIYREGEPLEYLYIVHQGRVKVYYLFSSGKEQLIRVLEPGEFMGELALFADKELDSYADAMEKTEICMIHRSDMQQLMLQHPTIAIKILEQFSNRIDETERLVGELSAKDVETRIAGYLLKLVKEKNRRTIVLPMSKKDLASYLGTTQETISRRLSNFQMNHVIEQKGHRHIEIIDEEALEDIAAEM
ncbi:MAG TPA: Crp/Fnr family transcriptional regulator [Bacillota bacterium]|nr:Crp/Fnr family transcriptional regulator [Bacillota bacterium]